VSTGSGDGSEARWGALGNARVRFWMCPVPEHDGRGEPIRQTVEWRDGVAHCLTPGCDRTSLDHRRAVEAFREWGD
jgi:hypothetical protein